MTLLVGFIMTLSVFIYAMNPENIGMYFHWHSFALVLGGTFSILLFTTPMPSLIQLKNEFLSLFKRSNTLSRHKEDLIKMSKNPLLQMSSDNELINYAQELWSQGVNQELFVVLLSQKKSDIELRSVDAIQCLKNLAKYPPALGMVGTVIGMVSLFQTMAGNKESIGPSLALAMTATFLGLALANAFVMPLADRMQLKHIQEKTQLTNIYQILLLISQQEPQNLIEDEVVQRAA